MFFCAIRSVTGRGLYQRRERAFQTGIIGVLLEQIEHGKSKCLRRDVGRQVAQFFGIVVALEKGKNKRMLVKFRHHLLRLGIIEYFTETLQLFARYLRSSPALPSWTNKPG